MSEPVRRVLSIQSHVVSGYVGNKSATFPLQVLFVLLISSFFSCLPFLAFRLRGRCYQLGAVLLPHRLQGLAWSSA